MSANATLPDTAFKTVQNVLDKHYLVRDDAFAISAGNKLSAYIGKGLSTVKA